MSMVVCFVWWAFRFWQYLESNKTYFHRCHPSLLIGAYKCTQGANFRQVSRYICIRHIATLPLPGWSLARTALTVGLRAPPGQSLSLPMFKGLKTKPGNSEERQFFFKLVRESLKFVSLTALENRTEMMKIGCTRGGRWLTRKKDCIPVDENHLSVNFQHAHRFHQRPHDLRSSAKVTSK